MSKTASFPTFFIGWQQKISRFIIFQIFSEIFQNWRKPTQRFENSGKGNVPLHISEHQKPAAKCSGNAFGARFLSETLSATGKISEILSRNISEINQIYPVPQQAGQKVSTLHHPTSSCCV